MTITFTAPPTLPSLSDPANFNDRALGLFGWLTGTFIPELEGVEGLVPDGGDFNVDAGTFFVDVSTNMVGIGTTTPNSKLHVQDSSSGDLTVQVVNAGTGNARLKLVGDNGNEDFILYTATDRLAIFDGTSEIVTFREGGNVGIGTIGPSEKLDVVGNVTISGSLSKGSGSFKIDHPIKPETHHLVHSFVESPQADNIYRGTAVLVGGQATVNLDTAGRMTEGTFVALNGNIQCFTSNEDGWTAVRGSVSGNILTIEAQDNTCTDTVSWMVVGERIDQHMIDASWTDDNGRVITEPLKPETPE